MNTLYNLDDTQVSEIPGITIPDWIEQDITVHQVAAIIDGGCDSGAYMPAVNYPPFGAGQTMAEHGNEVLEFIEDHSELPQIEAGASWSGIACIFLSHAVELWCAMHEDKIASALADDDWDALDYAANTLN